VFLERPVSKSELHKVRDLHKPVGWRHYPGAHGREPCGCPACLPRGEPYSK